MFLQYLFISQSKAQLEVEYTIRVKPSINVKYMFFFWFCCVVQVALNWLVAQGNVIPIPGAKNAEQAKEFAGAIGWSLTDNEVSELRSMASEINPVVGFPVEYL